MRPFNAEILIYGDGDSPKKYRTQQNDPSEAELATFRMQTWSPSRVTQEWRRPFSSSQSLFVHDVQFILYMGLIHYTLTSFSVNLFQPSPSLPSHYQYHPFVGTGHNCCRVIPLMRSFTTTGVLDDQGVSQFWRYVDSHLVTM